MHLKTEILSSLIPEAKHEDNSNIQQWTLKVFSSPGRIQNVTKSANDVMLNRTLILKVIILKLLKISFLKVLPFDPRGFG